MTALPVPDRERWSILRAGVVNVWEFDDQEFVFHRGRLILRGRNESGKSKTLELLLPFLLDASLRPERLGAERNTSRKMYWNLLNDLNPEDKQRTGYLWIEFGRLDANAVCTLTLGAGLSARRDSGSDVTSWFFVTRHRIGEGLSLVAGGEVVTRRALTELVGDQGQVFDSGAEYRRRVNDELFGMEHEQYDALINTLLELRQPKLSKNLDVERVSALLAQSLPPLDSDVVGRLATDFEELEDHRASVEARRVAARNVKDALRVVRRYALVVGRSRADALTTADSQFHKANATLRERQDALARAQEAIRSNQRDQDENERALLERRSARDTFLSSDAYRAVQQIAEQEELERRAAQDLDEASTGLERSGAALRQASDARDVQAAALEHAVADEDVAWGSLAAAATAADIASEGLASARADAERWSRKQAAEEGRRWLADPRAVLAELRRLAGAVDEARAEHAKAEERESSAHEDLRSTRARRDEAAAQHERAEDAFRDAVSTWAQAADWARVVTFDPEAPVEPAPLEDLARGAASLERGRIRTEDQAVAVERGAQEERRAKLVDQIAALLAAPHPEPTAPAWRDPRAGPGAPFYLLCDFAPHVDPAVAARIEGALLGIGLLDAWVSPDGSVLGSTHELFATRRSPAPGPTLADWLVITERPEVPPEVVTRLLRAVPVLDRLDPDGDLDGLDLQGGWRQGVLYGSNPQAEVRFVGATARERERERRLQELRSELAEVDAALAQLLERARALREEAEAVEAHLRRFPSGQALVQAAARLESQNQVVAERQRALDAASRGVATSLAELGRATDAQSEAARRLHRTGWIDRLDALDRALDQVKDAIDDWSSAAREVGRARSLLTEREVALASASEREASARATWTDRRNRHAEATARLRALRETLHATPEEILARANELKTTCADLETRLEALRQAWVKSERECATAEADLKAAEASVASWSERRSAAHDGLAAVVRLGLARIVLGSAEDPSASTLTEAIEVARSLARAQGEVEPSQKAIEGAENRLTERYEQLKRELPREYALELERRDWVVIVEARSGEEVLPLDHLERRLHDQLVEQQKLLEEEENRVLADFLTGATRRHLRDRLLRARELVDGANRILSTCPTPQGTRIKLDWKLGDDAPPAAQRAIEVLRLDTDAQTTSDREALHAFLQERLARARAEEGSLKERMLALLDYRQWHRFDLQTSGPGQQGWHRLTPKAHGAGSGGQKAVLLHLPLFAAAAAFYDSGSPTAPRLVLLDEAFAGVDTPMRAELLGLLCKLQIDFVLTSFAEWGCYASVDGTAIYQLTREKGMAGVLAERYVWDGTVRTAFGDGPA